MVLILQENRRPSRGEQLGKALSGALQGYLENRAVGEKEKRAFERQNQLRQMQNMEQRELDYQNSLRDQQALEAESEAAKRFGVDLSGIKDPKMRQMALGTALKGEQINKNKAEEAATRLAGEQKTQDELVKFADRLEGQNPKYKGIADVYRLDIPLDQKTKIVTSLTGSDVYREDQQRRLQLDSVLKRYNSRLKEIDAEIKDVPNPNSTGKEQVAELRRQRMALRNERDQLLDFKALSGYDDDELEEEDEEAIEEEGPKVKFDSTNPKHRAVAEKLFKQHKDKEKVRKILSKQFKGL